MLVRLFLLLGWVLDASSQSYYQSAEGKTGVELRRALHQIIRNHRVTPYSSSSFDTSDALKVLDQDPSSTNNVILIYARRSEPKSTFGLTTGWNREHLWPNSYGLDDQEPAYSDLHNLRAADATVNSARGNKLYDESDPADPNYRLPGHAEAPQTSTDTDSWEPPDVVKGDIARAMFYMDVRYEGGTVGEADLKLTDVLSWVSSASNNMSRLSVLLKWHEQDPVDSSEMIRNEQVYTLYQTNRNPFIDRPGWVREVFWPRLTIEKGLSSWSLQWPVEYADALVEVSTNLVTWSRIDSSTRLMGTSSWMMQIAFPAAVQFYRLKW